MTHDADKAWERLAAVLEAENEALAALDLGRAAGMLAAKEAALAGIGAAGAARSSQPAPCARERLAAIDTLTRDNRRLLERAIATQAKVLELVAEAARAAMAQTAPSPRYGTPAKAAPRHIATTPLALSRTA